MMVYPIGTSGQQVQLVDDVVRHLLANRQLRRRQTEAGGQLFARLQGSKIIVVEATGPRLTDYRTRTTYHPDRDAEILEIRQRHEQGLHFIGDWHTHPDAIPQPSTRDLESMSDCFIKSSHQLNGFLLLIVGTADAPRGFHLTVHNGGAHYILDGRNAAPIST